MATRDQARVGAGWIAACAVIAVLAFAPGALAFYPRGEFTAEGNLIIPRWPLSYLDVNGDGDIGPGEGVEITFETGALGWTSAEIEKVKEGLGVWERVSTAYVRFRYGQTLPNPPDVLETNTGLSPGAIDFYNYCAVQVGGEAQNLPAGIGAICYPSYVLEDTTLTLGDYTVEVTGGQVIEVDIVFEGPAIRPAVEGEQSPLPLDGVAVWAGGTTMGLADSPLTNLDESVLQGDPRDIESRVVWLPGRSGSLEKVGVTPTMAKGLVYYDDGGGVYTSTLMDLAPDDIAGITYLYPRANMDEFFDLSQEARTMTRSGFPSSPVAGGHVVAWCDADNNPNTARVAFMDTLTSLYVANNNYNSHLRGRFSMKNLFKLLQTEGGEVFNANYVFTLSALYTTTQRPNEDFDSTHSLGSGYVFDTGYPSQTFREGGNLLSIERRNQGTPLMFDSVRRQIVSMDSGKTLEQMLPGTRPMFGDQNQTCVLAAATAGIPTNRTPQLLRKVRDAALLHTAIGAAVADAYYGASPAMVHYLVRHGRVFHAVREAARGLEWASMHGVFVGLAIGVAGGAVAGLVLLIRRRRAAATLLPLLLAAMVGTGGPVSAQFRHFTTQDMVGMSDDIVAGRVKTVHTHWDEKGTTIVTDITVEVNDTLKGRMNKGGAIQFRQIGGRMGAIVTDAVGLAKFAEGEEALLFLERVPNGMHVVAGERGKYAIVTDPKTGVKTLKGGTRDADYALQAAKSNGKAGAKIDAPEGASARTKGGGEPLPVALEDFKKHVRELVNAEAKSGHRK